MKNFALALFILAFGIKLYASESPHSHHHKKKDHGSTIHIDIEAGKGVVHESSNHNELGDSTDTTSSVFNNTKVRLAIITSITSIAGAAIGAGVTLAIQYSKCKN